MWLWLSQILFFFSFCLFAYYAYFKLIASKYWKNRNVFQIDPVFLLGTKWSESFLASFTFSLADRYKKWKDKKLIGYWVFTKPTLLVSDIELIKKILIRDFDHFVDRNTNVNEKIDPLAGHLFNMKGNKWRNLRVKLTPTFTSGKMKMMFPTIVECGHHLRKYLKQHAINEDQLEMREVFARFTTDIISSCAFGIEPKTMDNPDSEFRTYSKKIFAPRFSLILRFIIISFFPIIRDILKIRFVPKDVSKFFINLIKDTTEYREKNNVKRNDFLDLLIQLKNKGRVDDVDIKHENMPIADQKFTILEAAAQAFVFFVAGFETSSTTLSFALYELALHPEIQTKLQQEIDSCLEKSNGEITYDAIMEMEYLDWVVQETLRKYPPVTALGRKCTKEYHIPEINATLEKDTTVFISVLGLHRDPEYYPDPDRFDPNRFSSEEKSKRDRFTFLPFGEGPRNCIGSRFALLQTKVGLISVFSDCSVEVSEKTSIPLVFNKRTPILTPVDGIQLKITQRKK